VRNDPPTPPRERAERNRRAALARRAAKRAQQRSDLDVDRLLAEPSPYVAMPPPEAPLARRARPRPRPRARRFAPPPPAAAQTEDEYFVDELLDAMGCLPFSKAALAKPSF